MPVSRDLLSAVGPRKVGQSSPSRRVRRSGTSAVFLAGSAAAAGTVSTARTQSIEAAVQCAGWFKRCMLQWRFLIRVGLSLSPAAPLGGCLTYTISMSTAETPQSGAPALTVNNRVRIPFDEFEFSYARSSGPGGQNVNKVNSKALLRWPVRTSPSLPEPMRQRFLSRYGNRVTAEGDVLISSQRYRDQAKNVDD